MKTKPNSRIKKLSTAIRNGYKIAQEAGIKISRKRMFQRKKNGEIQCACALGLASIGLYGINTPVETENTLMLFLYGQKHPFNDKLHNQSKGVAEHSRGYVKDTVMYLNDNKRWNPEKIADLLKSAKL